jgi:hypothetical protein
MTIILTRSHFNLPQNDVTFVAKNNEGIGLKLNVLSYWLEYLQNSQSARVTHTTLGKNAIE